MISLIRRRRRIYRSGMGCLRFVDPLVYLGRLLEKGGISLVKFVQLDLPLRPLLPCILLRIAGRN